MSAPGPSSVPTSADPRSRRPTKKRLLSPTSAQAASVDALFAKPDQDVRIPSLSSSNKRPRHAPPEIVTNVQGSSAGAGSGEFHVYKASRRREYERLRQLDEDLQRQQDRELFEKERASKLERDEEKTRKNREKREKMKARKANKAKGTPGAKAHPHNHDTALPDDRRVADDDGSAPEQKANSLADQKAPVAAAVGLVIHDND